MFGSPLAKHIAADNEFGNMVKVTLLKEHLLRMRGVGVHRGRSIQGAKKEIRRTESGNQVESAWKQAGNEPGPLEREAAEVIVTENLDHFHRKR
jgi:hypothetical protein